MEEELSKEAIRGAIKYDCVHSKMSLKQIASKYNVNVRTVYKWRDRTDVNDKKRVRRTKFKKFTLLFKSIFTKYLIDIHLLHHFY